MDALVLTVGGAGSWVGCAGQVDKRHAALMPLLTERLRAALSVRGHAGGCGAGICGT
jgi:hypothetical protein